MDPSGTGGFSLAPTPAPNSLHVQGWRLHVAPGPAPQQLGEVAPDVSAVQGVDEGVDEGVGLTQQEQGVLERAGQVAGAAGGLHGAPHQVGAPGEAEAHEDDEHSPQCLAAAQAGGPCPGAAVPEPPVLHVGDAAHPDVQAEQHQQGRSKDAKADHIEVLALGHVQEPTTTRVVATLEGGQDQRQVPKKEGERPESNKGEDHGCFLQQGGVGEWQRHRQVPVQGDEEQGQDGADARRHAHGHAQQAERLAPVKTMEDIAQRLGDARHAHQQVGGGQVEDVDVAGAWLLPQQLADRHDHQQVGWGDEAAQEGAQHRVQEVHHLPGEKGQKRRPEKQLQCRKTSPGGDVAELEGWDRSVSDPPAVA